MNLIIDVGNSFVKLAVFEADRILDKKIVTAENFLKNFENFIEKHQNIEKGIMSSVGNLTEADVFAIQNACDMMLLNHDTPVPFFNQYSTPKTLGIDRIALVSAAVSQYKNKNVLVIDAGTCITYDFVSAESKYYGGAISPGLNLRYKALNNYTAKLPLLKPEEPTSIIGDSTNAAIHSGVVFGILNEIDGSILNYQEQFGVLTIILTGGDANFLSKQLKSSIFANSNFLLEGLNTILQFNSHE
ncbi:pantothenate kinase type III, CoaX-like [Formosa agariphila KMM 3901]|uniref:Type III pantothenate kinase n=1 Tax=Formosa agariphila (strain DSM 15362 / KCTC 12365 / LMG 23005 / KMM 3901 / M-2Alg 35-1) TaxID=1347342 RepID=T2KPA8_FORAG|nr:type III pantothenate kinase [Formosa agariphila]CDF80692.1 pantothenate kinase type III, CoaX-like [Formosa agariphila KMM 3901]